MMRTAPLLALAMFAFACGPADDDGDGFTSTDCNDDDASVFPGAPELCDGLDNNCNDEVDEQAVDAGLFFLDEDGDLHGSTKDSVSACEAPIGFVPDASDCNDADPEANPSAPELCNLKDDNCNGIVDDSPVDAPVWYADADKDSWGSNTLVVKACESPIGYISVGGDCNDFEFLINPVAVEYCDRVDNDCDGVVDEADALDHSVFYKDKDGDGYGDSDILNSAVDACWLPDGYSENADDCNDDPVGNVDEGIPNGDLQNPGLEEICRNGFDDNCDGEGNQCSYKTWETSEDATRVVLGLSGSSMGYDMVPAGDVDGDGIEDFWIGAYYASVDGVTSGAGHLLYGRIDEDFLPEDDKIKAKGLPTFHTDVAYDYTGRVVAAGELNADAFGDIAIGGYSLDKADSYSSEGGVFIIYGASKRFDGEYNMIDEDYARFYGENRSDNLGYGMVVGRSVGADKVQDMLVSAPYYDKDGDYSVGAVYIIPGVNGAKYEGENSLADKARIVGTEAYFNTGNGSDSLAIGDFNGDSRGDMVIGAYGVDSYAGAVYLWWGVGVDPKGEISTDSADVVIDGTRYLGKSIAAVQDLNDDGYEELVLGEGYAGSYAGACYVYFGGAGGIGSKLSGADITINGTPNSYLCNQGADAGDLDNNGSPELVMNAYYTRDSNAGAVGAFYILEGGASIPTGTLDAGKDLQGEVLGHDGTYTYFGYNADVADYNNDGYDDIFASAYSPSLVYIFNGTDW